MVIGYAEFAVWKVLDEVEAVGSGLPGVDIPAREGLFQVLLGFGVCRGVVNAAGLP